MLTAERYLSTELGAVTLKESLADFCATNQLLPLNIPRCVAQFQGNLKWKDTNIRTKEKTYLLTKSGATR